MSLTILFRRKRFKRFFEKDEEPIQIKGSVLGDAAEGAAVPKAPRTPRTPKPKTAKPANSSDDGTASPVKSVGSKRKKAAMVNDTVPVSDDDVAVESPKKKARKTPTKPRKSAKSPRTPPTTEPPGTPNAPLSHSKTPQANIDDSDDEALKRPATDNGDSMTDMKENGDVKTNGMKAGSPAISAKTDVLIKATEEANGITMGEPAKQAKRDAVESAMKE